MRSDYAEIDGVRTKRPEKQDIKPKAFKHTPLWQLIMTEPTDRRILWIIANYPYFMNVFYYGDLVNNNDIGNPDSRLNKYMAATGNLFNRSLIKYSDKKRLTYK